VSESDKDAEGIIQKLRSSQSELHNAVTAAGDIISEWDSAKTFRKADSLRETKRENKESEDELMREKERLHDEYSLKQRELKALIDENKTIFHKKREKLHNDRQTFESFVANVQTKERKLHMAEDMLAKRARSLDHEAQDKRAVLTQLDDELKQQKKQIQSELADLKHEINMLKSALKRRESESAETENSMKERFAKLEDDFRHEIEFLENTLREERKNSEELMQKKDEELKTFKKRIAEQQKLFKRAAILEEDNKSLIYRCRDAEGQVEALKESPANKAKKHTVKLASLTEELAIHQTAMSQIEEKLEIYEMKLLQREDKLREIITAKNSEIKNIGVNEKKTEENSGAKIRKHKHQKKFKCSVCNIEVPENAKFCPGCGEEFT